MQASVRATGPSAATPGGDRAPSLSGRARADRVPALLLGGLGALVVVLAEAGRVQAAAAATGSYAPLTLATALGSWSFEPLVVVGTLLSLAAYLAGVRSVDRAHPKTPVPAWRTVSWVAGVLVIFVALSSSIDIYSDALFSVHMIQHLLLMMVGAPLLAMGAPMTLLLRAATPVQRRRWILPVLHSLPVRILTHPLVTWILFAAVLWGSHFSPLYELSLEDERIHILEHLLYVVSAYLFWLPVVGADPIQTRLSYPLRLGYLALQMPQNSFLSLAIWQAGDVLYPSYAHMQVPGWISPIGDQQLAGGIMLMAGDMMFFASVLIVAGAWILHEEAEGLRVDARLERQRLRAAALEAAGRGASGGPGEGGG